MSISDTVLPTTEEWPEEDQVLIRARKCNPIVKKLTTGMWLALQRLHDLCGIDDIVMTPGEFQSSHPCYVPHHATSFR